MMPREIRRDFFGDLAEKLRAEGFGNNPKVTQKYVDVKIGRTGYSLSVAAHDDDTLRVKLFIDTKDGTRQSGVAQLRAETETIAAEIGSDVAWEHDDKAGGEALFVAHRFDGNYSAESLEAAREWAVSMMRRFDKALRHRVRNLP